MKKKILSCFLLFFFAASQLPAQETGAAAVDATEINKSSSWKNWVFAGSALITVVAGVVIISLNKGGSND